MTASHSRCYGRCMLRRRSATLSSAQSLDAPTGITWTRCKKCGKYAKEHGGFLQSIPIATRQFMPFVVGWWGSRHRPDADLEPMVSNSDLKKIWQQRPTTAWTHPPSIGSVVSPTATLSGGGRGSGEDPRWLAAATRYLQYFIYYLLTTVTLSGRKEGGEDQERIPAGLPASLLLLQRLPPPGLRGQRRVARMVGW